MSEATHKTYSFSTFQEMFDRVPSGRIADCLRELGIALQGSKATMELIIEMAKAAAKERGKEFPEVPEQIITLPAALEWIDDGNGDVSATLRPEDGSDEGITLQYHLKP